MSYIYPITKNNLTKYQAYYIYKEIKIYIGSYTSQKDGQRALESTKRLMQLPRETFDFHNSFLNFKKMIALCNLRDNGTYIKNPIYVYPTYFHYYLNKDIYLIFDLKDLFYFSSYKIFKRGEYIYTQDSVSQQSILSRFGVKKHSVKGKDYIFKNNNPYDFRRSNLQIINSYAGVSQNMRNDQTVYTATIYNDKNLVLGHYASEIEAAIAYNKAADFLMKENPSKTYILNVIPFLTLSEYNALYDKIILSPRLSAPHQVRRRIISQKTYRGIYRAKHSFKACIGYHGKQIYLGMYPTEKRAAQAYNFASFYLFGNNGYINEVTPLIEDGDAVKIAGQLEKQGINKNKKDSSSL